MVIFQVPATMSERRAEVVKKLHSCSEAAVPITAFLSNGNLLKQLRQDRMQNLAFLAEHNVGEADIEALYTYAKFQFDCGNYSGESRLALVGCSSVSHGEVLRERERQRRVCVCSYWHPCLLSPLTPNRRFGSSALKLKT